MTDSLVYRATVSSSASGQAYNIVSSSGAVVATGVVGAADSSGGNVAIRATLPQGTYNVEGQRAAWPGTAESVMTVDLPASIAAAGGGGGETAKFIGRATADTSGDEFALVFTADGAVDWASVNGDGDIAVEAPVSVNMVYRYHGSLDFTDVVGFTTDYSPDTGVAIKASRFTGDGFASNCGGPYFFIATGTEGTVFPIDAVEEGITQTQRAAANAGELVIHGTVNANGYDTDHVRVTGGVLTAAVAVWITRNALPDLPDLP